MKKKILPWAQTCQCMGVVRCLQEFEYFTYYNVKIIYIKHSIAHHENIIKLMRENTNIYLYKYTGGQLHLCGNSSVTQ